MPNTLSSFLGLGWGEEQGGKRSATGTFFFQREPGNSALCAECSSQASPRPGGDPQAVLG